MKRIVIYMLAAAVLAGTSARASFECYLKMPIQGESTAEGHTNEITLETFAFDVARPGLGASQTSGLSLVKALDKASPLLALRCADGTTFPDATITCRSSAPGRPIFYRITLVDVNISQVALQADAPSQNRPRENLTLRFTRIRWEYWPILPDGTQGTLVRWGWDFAAQRPY